MKVLMLKRNILAALAVVSAVAAGAAQASVITYQFTNNNASMYDGGPLINAPANGVFATATFTDVSSGKVELTLSVPSGLSPNAFVDFWTFNLLNGSLDSVVLKSGQTGGTVLPSPLPATSSTNNVVNGGAANNKFDFGIDFAKALKELDGSSTATYTLTGSSGFNANSFFTSNDAGIYAAVHVGSNGNGGSYDSYFKTLSTGPTGNVPEPATLSILGLGLAGLGMSRRRKSAAQ